MNLERAIATFRGHTVPHFRIVQQRRRWAIASGIVILLSLVGLFARGINLSIEFTGGTQLIYDNPAGASVDEIRSTLAAEPYAREEAEIQQVGTGRVAVRTTSLIDLSPDERTALIGALAAQAGIEPDAISQQVVGPTWGAQISRQALLGLVVVLIAITLYITLRFEWKMAIGAMVALVHDVVITAGIYALSGREVAPATVIAILTILGFSLYDTVVIFDKVKENADNPAMLGRATYEDVANASMNQVFMRSVNTSLVVILPIVSLFLFGGATLKDFALAMLIGTTTAAAATEEEAPALMDIPQLRALVRDVPDFPKPGIVFKDITPLLADPLAFSTVIDLIVVHFGRGNVDKVVGIEARGFILASPVAYHFGAGFVPVRKAGKLPADTAAEEYSLEYGAATLEIHTDTILPDERVLIVDDVLATGGTARAAANLVERVGGTVVGIACLIELGFLGGRATVGDHEVFSLLEY
jgi:adenine phosphoribosyltransferase